MDSCGPDRQSRPGDAQVPCRAGRANGARSEEHTSELQSRLHLVCRLLPEKKNYDLLILDLVMPDVDGLSVLQQILERKPSQPVLVLSALSDTASKLRSLELVADDYLSKPFSLEELLARVRARLRTAARTDQTKLAVGRTTLD